MSNRGPRRYVWVMAGCLPWGAWAGAAAPPIEAPSLPLPSAPFTMPHLPPPQGNKVLQPHLVLPETLGPLEPGRPPAPALPAGERVRLPSVDVKRPVPLPILGQPLSDRAPIEDVTSEASSASAVAAPTPRRTQPTPFVKNNLPDPFEFRRPVVPAMGVEAQPTPPAASPKLPRP